MASLEELAKQNGNLDDDLISYLQDLTRTWGLLADLSFSEQCLHKLSRPLIKEEVLYKYFLSNRCTIKSG